MSSMTFPLIGSTCDLRRVVALYDVFIWKVAGVDELLCRWQLRVMAFGGGLDRAATASLVL